MWQSVIAILGTLAGAAVSAWFQQRGQRDALAGLRVEWA